MGEQDKLYGNNGDDILQGGFGYDKLYGGAGNDTFNFLNTISSSDFTSGGDGVDVFYFDPNIEWWDGSDEQIETLKTYGIQSEGGPGDDLWFDVDGGSFMVQGAIALGNFNVNCGAGNDIFHLDVDSKSLKVLKSEGAIIDGRGI